MTNAYLICGDHMQPATDKFCPICREKERIARDHEAQEVRQVWCMSRLSGMED
jgi:hypothetical protein